MSRLALPRSQVIVRKTERPKPLTDALRGRVVEEVLAVRAQLLIRCTDGTEVRLSWRDGIGRVVGTPMLDETRRWK